MKVTIVHYVYNHLQTIVSCRRCDVLNRGFSGYNTRWCKVLLPAVLDEKLAKETVVLVIFLGANDSNWFEKNPRQHVPLDEYKLNLKEMVEFSLVSYICIVLHLGNVFFKYFFIG